MKNFLLNRRDLFRRGGWLAAAGLGPAGSAVAGPLRIGPDIYQSIGVQPVINAKGTFTIVSGSLSLPEVKKAMEEAGRHYVHMDELMAAAGKRLAEITGAEWGIITAGCAAALTHATAACIAGADPEKMQRLPDLTGLKNEVIVPKYSRNVYDHAIRMLGVKMVEVSNIDELRAAINARTAMIMILAGPGDEGPLGTKAVAEVANQRGVPLIVDAAAERLTIPNVHLQRGATMVAYSGGKCLRGPQCAGMLLGKKELLQAAWINSAPHHAFGRSLKVGKEEIIGMLTAVEMWTKRDHKAEWAEWESWLDHISKAVTKVDGVTTRVTQPQGLSNNAPQLHIEWDTAKVGISGEDLERIMLAGPPRIVLGGASGRGKEGRSTAAIMPYMMSAGDEKPVASRMHALLSKPPKIESKMKSSAAPASVAGQWDVDVKFLASSARHTVVFEQTADRVVGTHMGETLGGDLRGTLDGQSIHFTSSHKIEGTRLGYDFSGGVSGDTMSGTVALGEYGQATWTAKRHQYGTPGGVVRPVKNV